MNKLVLSLLLLSGLASCSTAAEKQPVADLAKVDPTQAAVSAYLKKTLDDPASYQPAQWSQATPWLQKDADALAAQDAAEKSNISLSYAKKATGYSSTGGRKFFSENIAEAKHFQRLEDSLLHSTNTINLGCVITHAFRAKNKMGALVLDSAQFIVYNTGKVKPLR